MYFESDDLLFSKFIQFIHFLLSHPNSAVTYLLVPESIQTTNNLHEPTGLNLFIFNVNKMYVPLLHFFRFICSKINFIQQVRLGEKSSWHRALHTDNKGGIKIRSERQLVVVTAGWCGWCETVPKWVPIPEHKMYNLSPARLIYNNIILILISQKT